MKQIIKPIATIINILVWCIIGIKLIMHHFT